MLPVLGPLCDFVWMTAASRASATAVSTDHHAASIRSNFGLGNVLRIHYQYCQCIYCD